MRINWFTTATLFVVMSLASCGDHTEEVYEFISDFNVGGNDWAHGFSDYDPSFAEGFEFQYGIRSIPGMGDTKGFLLAAQNRSDDLFMFLKTRLTGLEPYRRYSLVAQISFYSNAGSNCVGIGGAPGENVYLKVGYSTDEPIQNGYDLNVDKGGQSDSGRNAMLVGNVAIDGLECTGQKLGRKHVISKSDSPLILDTDDSGSVWIFVGTDSGFEGLTELYYESIKLILKPQ